MAISYQIYLFLEIFIKLLISALCASVLAFDRETSIQPHHSKILIMTSVGACLMVILWDINFGDAIGLSIMFFSSMIVFVGIISSAIIITYHGSLAGVSVAISIWVATGIGMSVGYSQYFAAITATVVVYLFFRILINKSGSV